MGMTPFNNQIAVRSRQMMNDVASATPFLTSHEVDELCAPLKQRHAQMRHLCALLGVRELPRRPDGLPLVGRRMVEERLNGGNEHAAPRGFNWSN
jgi:hypothetical protein